MMNYKILTEKSVLDIQEEIAELDSNLQEIALTNLWEQQNNLVSGSYFAIHYIEDKHYINESYETSNNIDDAIQCLAIKDGIDIIQFDNGNMGFMAYYNGNKNCFEFKTITEQQYNELDETEDIEKIFN